MIMLPLTNNGPVPKSIEKQMKLWRMGATGFPQAYIDLHEEWARNELEAWKTQKGVIVHNTYLESSGWFDGMMELTAIIETKKHKLMKVKWCDSNRGFMECFDATCGGRGIMMDNALDS